MGERGTAHKVVSNTKFTITQFHDTTHHTSLGPHDAARRGLSGGLRGGLILALRGSSGLCGSGVTSGFDLPNSRETKDLS